MDNYFEGKEVELQQPVINEEEGVRDTDMNEDIVNAINETHHEEMEDMYDDPRKKTEIIEDEQHDDNNDEVDIDIIAEINETDAGEIIEKEAVDVMDDNTSL